MQPVMSVLICVGPGSAPFLKAAVESVVRAEPPDTQPLEIVLALNRGSGPAEHAVAEELSILPGVVLTCSDGTGYADNINTAWSAATGEYIARQDADDLTHPWRFAASHFALQGEGIHVVTCNMVRFESGDGFGDGPAEGCAMDWPDFWYGRHHGPPAATAVCHRNVYRAVMPLSEKYSITADSEWIVKAYESGFTNWLHLDFVGYAYRQHAGQMTKRNAGAHAMYQALVRERIPACLSG